MYRESRLETKDDRFSGRTRADHRGKECQGSLNTQEDCLKKLVSK